MCIRDSYRIITVAMEVLGMDDLKDAPNECIVPPGLANSSQSAMVTESGAQVIISDFNDLTHNHAIRKKIKIQS